MEVLMPDCVNPKYAAVVEQLRAGEQDRDRPDTRPRPLRAFLLKPVVGDSPE
ncbi:hypothetical protein ACEZCY_16660 [Streptacidiphilus sp. N1-12]|uniref:Uncharacterized protein n=2 Tax=Streptacidiphilus alkalitolerans TaxID=3342712 RepID=A0ABV6WGG4_9ACTN